MSDVDALLRAIVARPDEATQTWLVLADLLEERADPRHELIRLQHEADFRPELTQAKRLDRIRELLVAGVRPCVPEWTNELGMRFVWVGPGTFMMGSPIDEPGRYGDEDLHPVTLSRGFWLGATPVTQAQWHAVTGESPSQFVGPDRPVERVSCHRCEDFLARMGQRDGRAYRLPTEAEREYACRAGTTSTFFWGDTLNSDLANYDASRSDEWGPATGINRDETTDVGQFPPNAWGLWDMHGTVWEWCADFYEPYAEGAVTDPLGTASGASRLARGGPWRMSIRRVRSADRSQFRPDETRPDLGMRAALSEVG